MGITGAGRAWVYAGYIQQIYSMLKGHPNLRNSTRRY
jgi:hypothetical protein